MTIKSHFDILSPIDGNATSPMRAPERAQSTAAMMSSMFRPPWTIESLTLAPPRSPRHSL
uniref:Uncharacterized protein n=1 Tax=Oryza punctata TaxID=4537 RepID=A0A0E0KEW8_ORYPU